MLTDKERIKHMLETIDVLTNIASKLTNEQYSNDIEKQYAVKFAFVMLGEDAAMLSDELKSAHAEIPWRQIKATRNTVAHDYNKTDDDILWNTVASDIAPLREALLNILKSDFSH